MLTYTSCASCGGTLTVDWPGHDTHEDCPPATDLIHTLRRAFLDAVANGDEAAAAHYEAELDALDNAPPRYLDAALAYAAWGWPVFPCREGFKTPATQHGFKEATTDPERIRDWWWRWPRANVAIATGRAFDVIDVDPDGADWWAQIHERHAGLSGDAPGALPDIHAIASTPRTRAIHVYIGRSGGGNLGGLVPGVDYRGLGGYVLVPPSTLIPAAYDTTPELMPGPLRYTWTSYPSPAIKPGLAEVGA